MRVTIRRAAAASSTALFLACVATAAACGSEPMREPRDEAGGPGGGDASSAAGVELCPDAACGTLLDTLKKHRDDEVTVQSLLELRAIATSEGCLALTDGQGFDAEPGELGYEPVSRVCGTMVDDLIDELDAAGGRTAYEAPVCGASLDLLVACAEGCACETCAATPFAAIAEPPLARCDGACQGKCLPVGTTETVSCHGLCAGKCSGTCRDVEMAGDVCAGVCDGTCDGPCESSTPAPCEGYCAGSCVGTASDIHQPGLPSTSDCADCARRCSDVVSVTSETCTRVGFGAPRISTERQHLARDYLQACAEGQSPELTRYLATLASTPPPDLGPSPTPEEQLCFDDGYYRHASAFELRDLIEAACEPVPRLAEALAR